MQIKAVTGPVMMKGNSAKHKTESFGMEQVRRTKSSCYPELHPELKMRGEKSQMTSLQKQLVNVILVKTSVFKAGSSAPGYMQKWKKPNPKRKNNIN